MTYTYKPTGDIVFERNAIFQKDARVKYLTPTISTFNTFGDSITAGYSAGGVILSPELRYANIIAATKNISSVFTNRGVSSNLIADTSDPIMALSVDDSTMSTYLVGYNDMRRWGLEGVARNIFKRNLMSNIVWLSIPDTRKMTSRNASIVYAGTWSNGAAGGYLNTISKYSSVLNATATMTVYGKTIYISTTSIYPLNSAGSFSVTIDGVDYGIIKCDDAKSNPSGRTWQPKLTRITGLSDKNHTVVLTVRESGKNAYFNYIAGIGNPSSHSGPSVYVGNCLRMNSTGYALGSPTWNNGSDTVVGEYNKIIYDVVNELASDGLNCVYVDASAIYDPTTSDSDTDNTHPSAIGHAKIATAFITEMQATEKPNNKTDHPDDKTTFESGFIDRTSSIISASVNAGIITFNIYEASSGSGYSYYRNGNKVFKYRNVTYPETVTLSSAIAGTLYYAYFNSKEVLTLASDPWDLSIDIPIATIYYDGTNVLVGDERHGATMDWQTHSYLHHTIGTRYASGLGGSFATNTTPTPDTVTMSIDSGVIYDEDILHAITGPVTNARIFYRNGAGANAPFIFTTPQAEPFMRVGAGGPLAYNQYTGAVWQLTDVGTGNYSVSWILATNEAAAPIWVILDQTVHTTITSAQNALFSSLALGTLPSAEIKLIYKLIVRKIASTSDVAFQEATDYRTIATVPNSSYIATDHNALSNRTASGSHPASAITTDVSNFNNLLTSSETTVQSALDKIDNGIFTGAIQLNGGRLTLEGTSRVIRAIQIPAGSIKVGITNPAVYIEHGLDGAYEFVKAGTRQVSWCTGISEDQDTSTTVEIIAGFSSPATTGNVYWQLKYRWIGDDQDTSSITPTGTVDAITAVSSTANGFKMASFTLVAPTTAMYGDFTLYRLAADGSDTVADVAHLVGLRFKYTANKLGT